MDKGAIRSSTTSGQPNLPVSRQGADISSNGLSFSTFKRSIVEEFGKQPIFEVTDDVTIDRRFQTFFQNEVNDEEQALVVEQMFRTMVGLSPSDSYKLLVLLAEARVIDAIITTNFDIMLEQAEIALSRNVFDVFALVSLGLSL